MLCIGFIDRERPALSCHLSVKVTGDPRPARSAAHGASVLAAGFGRNDWLSLLLTLRASGGFARDPHCPVTVRPTSHEPCDCPREARPRR